jgi:succinyl-CoA synthetase alpha subunit
MASGFTIRKNQYFDSVFLMGVNKRLSEEEGVQQTAVIMGTDNNKKLLADIGIADPQIDSAKPNDLIVAIFAETSEVVNNLLENLDKFLVGSSQIDSEIRLRTLDDGLSKKTDANLAVISIPGQFATREARKALEAGLNAFVFSSNVPIEDELELKQFASEKGLLVMGPDCGTSIINGVCIGFANKVRKGKIGVVGASGTGLQEFTTQVHNAGSGISHAIGTGSNDLKDEIGGITTIAALHALENDKNTHVIAIVSKPPGKKTLEKIKHISKDFKKPVIGCFLGVERKMTGEKGNLQLARTIDEAVIKALLKSGKQIGSQVLELTNEEIDLAQQEKDKISSEQKYVRGIFAGGTYCYQSQQIFHEAGIKVYSNGPLNKKMLLTDSDRSQEHTFVDMGDEHYTAGAPHPMIDGRFRKERISNEGNDPQVAILLLDFILGYNASMDPVGDIIDSIVEAKQIANQRGDYLCVVTSICGTEEDPQDLSHQAKLLSDAEVLVFNSNAKATLICIEIMK